MTEDEDTTWDRFHETVNMTARELEKWLATEESNAVGQKPGEANRPHRGRLRAHAQGSSATPSVTWRYSLMNWGHDPAKS